MRRVTSTEANRSFSKLLGRATKGEPTEITVRGKVVARLEGVPQPDPAAKVEKQKRWEEFIERLRNQPVLNIPRGTRDELYDDEP